MVGIRHAVINIRDLLQTSTKIPELLIIVLDPIELHLNHDVRKEGGVSPLQASDQKPDQGR
jgi:hypothetical protein